MTQSSSGQQLERAASSHDAEVLDACHAHGLVIPAESCAELADHQLVVLQQRSRALDREIAQRAQLELELRDLRARAAADAAVDAHYHALFSAMLGHDLRNQLGAVMMGADYIARLQLGDKPTRTADRVASSAVRMSRMIEQLLAFLQLWVGGGLVPAAVPVDLASLCRRVKAELEADHPAWTIDAELLGDATGRWDADGVLRVLSTLLGNAIAHGAGACQVQLRVDGRAARTVVVEVHNAGAIAPAHLATLFEPRWGDRPRHKSYGLGLGLFITKQIVDAHAGTIAVSSNEAHGTTVRVTLPRGPAAEPG